MNKENNSVKLELTPHPPCDPIKSHCVAGGRKRPSSIRRNLNREVHDAPELRVEEPYMPPRSDRMCKHFILDGRGNHLHNAVVTHDSASYASSPSIKATGSPPIQAAKKKMRSGDVAASLSGVRAGTPDAEALCRGDLKGGSIWDYFGSPTKPRRPSSAPRPLSARHNMRHKSACIAGGGVRKSGVVRNLRCFGRNNLDDCHVDDNDSPDYSRPSSPMSSVDFDLHPYQITVVSSEESHVDYGVCLPPIADAGKLMPPTLKALGYVLGDCTPRCRSGSMASVSTAPSESEADLSQTY